MARLLPEVFRCQEDVATFVLKGDLSARSGYFRLGPDVICYGQDSSGEPAHAVTEPLHDAREQVSVENSVVHLPFDPVQVVDNLRCERYLSHSENGDGPLPGNRILRSLYYAVRPAIGVPVRKHLQKLYFRGREKSPFPRWPVDTTVETIAEQLMIFALKSQNLRSASVHLVLARRGS